MPKLKGVTETVKNMDRFIKEFGRPQDPIMKQIHNTLPRRFNSWLELMNYCEPYLRNTTNEQFQYIHDNVAYQFTRSYVKLKCYDELMNILKELANRTVPDVSNQNVLYNHNLKDVIEDYKQRFPNLFV